MCGWVRDGRARGGDWESAFEGVMALIIPRGESCGCSKAMSQVVDDPDASRTFWRMWMGEES